MAVLSQERQITKKDLYFSLGKIPTEKLIRLKGELEDAVISGEFYESLSEVGRSSSQVLLANPHDSLAVVFSILAKRGKLTQEEIDDWVNSQPKTFKQVWFLPRIPYGYY